MLMIMILNDDDKSDDEYDDDNFKNAQECCFEKSGGEALQILDIIMIVKDVHDDDCDDDAIASRVLLQEKWG